MIFIFITAFYVISVMSSWAAIRKLNVVMDSRPEVIEVFFVLCPILNAVVLMIALSETNNYLNGRSIAEVFFMIRKGD